MAQTADAARESALKRFLPPGPRPLPCRRDVQRGRRLRLFVYGLPWAYHGQVVEYVERRARELLHVNCAYLREDTCPNTGFSHLENLRSHCTDVPIFSKLLQVATLVGEPERADVFLVPFLLGCNAMLGWGHGMSRVNGPAHHAFFGSFDKFARDSLPHFARWPHRHLFLFPLDSMFMPKWLGGSMLAHTGAGYRNKSRLDVTIPYLASLPRELVRAQPDAGARSTRVFLMASPSRNKENAMPFSTVETIRRMQRTTFCVAPPGDSDGFTQRFYYIVAAGCIPVRVDPYYPSLKFGKGGWPFKQTMEGHRAVLLLPPDRLGRDGLMPTLANVSQPRVPEMHQSLLRVVRPSVLFDYRGGAPDAFSPFLTELFYLAAHRLPGSFFGIDYFLSPKNYNSLA
ncbi:hypothetical protein EMIHUDRAFT_214563 [Emiliania huxleyi CCMP1516]|uniref:Exostosin GT47 domain-containing protein n=2 Tax=Emiliania huxleyi TaxID=2903 RepID=A0A0D3IJ48_EMIH1|nr:hypothetical protein EMIHUDRAFT_214563 [Emiliania huxleyi CCMP1516]EOD11283.1 hypothetical protein EMIHUDRAFT_214563 [Emiliania huxleyi CCMP1516]|eukprot:XP_005763712.1 hypothetical protein EMIHUDRAFT_214563 [Emiliania huxleyi CCMP1516]